MSSRIPARLAALGAEGRAAFVPFIMAGDPDLETSLELIEGLPSAGADMIEIGMPFTDPMADGPAIQLAGQRALAGGATLTRTLDLVRRFRAGDDDTPIILMGYYNPIFSRGAERFVQEAVDAGVDGLIIVDLPPEEDAELCLPAKAAGLDFVRLATPTTDAERAPAVLQNSSGFVYYVSITGVTGSAAADADAVGPAVARLRAASGLPVCVGFGVRTPARAAEIARVADGVVVGSAIVNMLGESASVAQVLDFVRELSDGVKSVAKEPRDA